MPVTETANATLTLHARVQITVQSDGSFVALGSDLPLIAIASSRLALEKLVSELVDQTAEEMSPMEHDELFRFLHDRSVAYEFRPLGRVPLDSRNVQISVIHD